MCKILKISRKTYYNYKDKKMAASDPYEEVVIEIFNKNHKLYGARKIKEKLETMDIRISRRRIRKIMKKHGLESVYQVKKYTKSSGSVNENTDKNILDREFNEREEHEVIVSDLTYVRVMNTWHYICIIIDLFNREIVGYSAGPNKTAELVRKAFSKIKGDLRKISIFHTDRGSEFDNYLIDEILQAFGIKRSLSRKGCPYDNAVAEATFKIIKKEFVRARSFSSLEELESELTEYVNWYNIERIHSSLGYMSPVEYKKCVRQKSV